MRLFHRVVLGAALVAATACGGSVAVPDAAPASGTGAGGSGGSPTSSMSASGAGTGGVDACAGLPVAEVVAPDCGCPESLVVDEANAYWIDYSVVKAAPAPGNVFNIELYGNGGTASVYELTGRASTLYWAEHGIMGDFVHALPTSGGSPTVMFSGEVPRGLATNGTSLFVLADALYRIPLAGGAPETLFAGYLDPAAANDTDVYAQTKDGDWYRVPLTGDPPIKLPINGTFLGLAATHIVLNSTNGIESVPLAGGNGVTLAHSGKVAVDATHAYVFDGSVVWRMPVTGAPPEPIGCVPVFEKFVAGMAVNATHVYLLGDCWVDDVDSTIGGTLVRIPLPKP